MEELGKYKYIIYIVIGILYLLFKGKDKKTTPKNTSPAPQPREENNQPQNYDSQTKSPAKNKILKSKIERNQDESSASKESLEISRPQVIDYEDDLNKKEIGTKQVSQMDETAGKSIDPYTQQGAATNPYGEMLKDPESIKKVFIAQEIFKPKF